MAKVQMVSSPLVKMYRGIFGTVTQMIGVLCDPSLGVSIGGANSFSRPIPKPLDGISTIANNCGRNMENTSSTTEAHLVLSFNPCYLALSPVKYLLERRK